MTPRDPRVLLFVTGATAGYIVQLQTLVYDRLLISRGYNNALRFIRVVLQPHHSTDLSYYVMPDPETLGYMAFEAGVSVSCVEGLLFETQVYEEVTNVEKDILFDYLYVIPPGVYVTVHGVATSNSLGRLDGTACFVKPHRQ